MDDELFCWLQVEIRFNKDRNLTYSVSYTPRIEGTHKVYVKFAGREIPKSPYAVLVEGHAGDASRVTASGPGLQPDGVMVNRPTHFDIFTKGMLPLLLAVLRWNVKIEYSRCQTRRYTFKMPRTGCFKSPSPPP